MALEGVRRASVRTRSGAETEALGARVGTALGPGACLLLTGPLGGGKTTFVRGLVRGLGGCPRRVLSPTFVLHAVYPGRLVVHHFDAYRLAGPEELLVWVEEALAGGGVVAVEWGAALRRVLPVPVLLIRFRFRGLSERDVVLAARRGRYEAALMAAREVGANPW